MTANAQYGASVSISEGLINCLPHAGPVFRDDNKTVLVVISKAVDGTSVQSTIKSYSRCKYCWAEFLALISNHAGDTKYQAIVKSISNLLHNIKWNERNYPLDQHVSNHRTAIDDLRDCTTHIMPHKLIWKISAPTLMS